MQVDLREMNNMIRWPNIYLVGFPLGDNGKNTGEATQRNNGRGLSRTAERHQSESPVLSHINSK